jgi:hypothetical protein
VRLARERNVGREICQVSIGANVHEGTERGRHPCPGTDKERIKGNSVTRHLLRAIWHGILAGLYTIGAAPTRNPEASLICAARGRARKRHKTSERVLTVQKNDVVSSKPSSLSPERVSSAFD